MKSFLKTTADSPLRAFGFFLFVGLLLYGIMLNAPFKTLDDLHSIVGNPLIRDFSHLKEIFTTSFFEQNSYYRPLVTLSFACEYQLFKLSSFFYNLNNVLLHVINACFMFMIVRLFAPISSLALVTSFVFLVHPLQAEAVGNIPGRAIVLGTVFLLASVYFFLQYVKQNQSLVKYILSVVMFALSLLCKESSIVIPGIMASYLYFYKGDHKKGKGASFGLLVPYLVIAGIYFWWRHHLGITHVARWEHLTQQLMGISTFLYALLIQLKNVILPTGLYYDHSTLLITSVLDLRFLLTAGIWLAVIAFLVVSRRKLNELICFWLSWIVINLVTVSQILPIKVADQYISTADHFLYVSSIGIFMLGGFFGYQLFQLLMAVESLKRPVIKFAIGAWVLFLMMVTLQQNIYSSQEIAMFTRSLERNPVNNRVRNSLAVAYAHAGQFKKTEELYRESLRIKADDAHAGIGLATSLADQGRLWEALVAYEQVTTAKGTNQLLLADNIKLALKQLEERYNARLINEPDNEEIYYSLGIVYFKMGKLDWAAISFKRALDLKSDYGLAMYNLASTYHEQNMLKEAKQYYQMYLSLNDTDPNIKAEVLKRLSLIP